MAKLGSNPIHVDACRNQAVWYHARICIQHLCYLPGELQLAQIILFAYLQSAEATSAGIYVSLALLIEPLPLAMTVRDVYAMRSIRCP